MNEKYFEEMSAKLSKLMNTLERDYGIKPIFTRELHWHDDPEDFDRLSRKAGTIANYFMAMSDILMDMTCEAEDAKKG